MKSGNESSEYVTVARDFDVLVGVAALVRLVGEMREVPQESQYFAATRF